jgi:hypothetical protein
MRAVLNDAVSIYFIDAMLASAFVARWCAASKVETEGGLFRIRDELGADLLVRSLSLVLSVAARSQ